MPPTRAAMLREEDKSSSSAVQFRNLKLLALVAGGKFMPNKVTGVEVKASEGEMGSGRLMRIGLKSWSLRCLPRHDANTAKAQDETVGSMPNFLALPGEVGVAGNAEPINSSTVRTPLYILSR
ncbi:hypothetical protein AXG93_1587s1190 [Marchantia polymorpha subsp. ruderalis]|uniref:Uncharacterized protein n=1 Tax=Marchantia polymorpha subsp. ruderalis TaxID=1480154 RepID=A0A176WP02_MARPO|nr:hypothetical protein AXG93_1587s1190 [Marchantia polymorpha subsp. ruderalis]